jgi:hypothetical protein
MTRPPKAHEADGHGIIVHCTHDIELATELVRPWYGEHPPRPVRTWLRTNPCRPDNPEGWAFIYAPANPGERGAFAAVEFPEDGCVYGTRVKA